MAMKAHPAPVLDRDRLVAAAFVQLEQDGLDGLSMRALAKRLGVQAPALYWHLGDKAELLGLMARDVYASAYAALTDEPDWRHWLIAFGCALRDSFARRRDGARLCAIARPPRADDVTAHAAHIAGPLMKLGLDQGRSLSYQACVISYALGWASFAANGPMHAFLAEMIDFETSFETGLASLVAGLPGD